MSLFSVLRWDALKSWARFDLTFADLMPEHVLSLTIYIKGKIHDIQNYVYVYVLPEILSAITPYY